MISFAVKAVFFALAISGMIANWVIMLILASIVGSFWIPVMYSVSVTILEVSFALGMIWKMDPSQMPLAFCRAQTILLSYGSFMATGVIVSFTQATAKTVFKQNTGKEVSKRTLEYGYSSALWIFAFPLVAGAALTAVVVKLDAAQPTGDDFHCDANSPEWVRFLGYAGVSIAIALPALLVSLATAGKLLMTHRRNNTSYKQQQHSASVIPTSPPPPKRPHYQLARASVSPSAYGKAMPEMTNMSTYGGSVPNSPIINKPPPQALSIQTISEYSPSVESPKTPLSDKQLPPYSLPFSRRPVPELTSKEIEALTDAGYPHHLLTPRLPAKSMDGLALPELERQESFDMMGSMTGNRHLVASGNAEASYLPPQSLMPAVWRLAFFQIAFFGIETLAALSTIIDVASNKPQPTPLGTQHFALLLAAWGPIFVFGHLPVVRQQVMGWFRRK